MSCPSSAQAAGSHVWAHAAAAIADGPSWSEKMDGLFWRGAATSVYRRQVLPGITALPGANVSFMEWVVAASGRQTVREGVCVPITEWCRHRFLANLPGNTMALSLKYKLLCGSVIVTPPLWYHEWYYSQLEAGVHYVEVDPLWTVGQEAMEFLHGNPQGAEAIAAASQAWARRHLTDDAFDCYWRHLVELAHLHFPHPNVSHDAVPLEQAMFAELGRDGGERSSGSDSDPSRTVSDRPPRGAPGSGSRPALDVAVVIPARAMDARLMDAARLTWLRLGSSLLRHRHFFVISAEDPDRSSLVPPPPPADTVDVEPDGADLLVVSSPHGYTWLLQKMALAYRALLAALDVSFFVRADADSVLPLPLVLSLLPLASTGQAVAAAPGHTCHGPVLWQKESVGVLVCQTQCAVDSSCEFFSVDAAGACAVFGSCERGGGGGGEAGGGADLYEYRLRKELSVEGAAATPRGQHAFLLGTILHGYRVLVNDTFNPQWNNPRYVEDLGIGAYPPYAEASGYAMSASVAAFLAGVGAGELKALSWKSWGIEDAALGTLLAGLNVSFLQLPHEVRNQMRVIRA